MMNEPKTEVFIPLTKGFVTVVDFEDFEKVRPFKWYVKTYKGKPYAARSEYLPDAWAKKKSSHSQTILMHRELTGVLQGQDVDHKNRNTLDNHQENLRVCSRSQNCANQKKRSTNTSGFKGVNWKQWENCGAWCARISVGMKRIHLGYFSTAEEAACAYDSAAIKYFGEFARLNFPKRK